MLDTSIFSSSHYLYFYPSKHTYQFFQSHLFYLQCFLFGLKSKILLCGIDLTALQSEVLKTLERALKTLWEKEKMLVTSISSIPRMFFILSKKQPLSYVSLLTLFFSAEVFKVEEYYNYRFSGNLIYPNKKTVNLVQRKRTMQGFHLQHYKIKLYH